MAELKDMRIGCAMTGSFCTFSRVFDAWRALKEEGAALTPIMSENAYSIDNRFFSAFEAREIFRAICQNEIIHTISAAEPIGPRKLLDAMVIAPCTGNTLAKLAWGIADTAVTLAAKSHLRNERSLIIAVSTNDGLARNARSIGALMAMRHVYFVPYAQDDPDGKPASLVARMDCLAATVEAALDGKQIQPVLLQN
jgi:dipicolinate synthase subunit B